MICDQRLHVKKVLYEFIPTPDFEFLNTLLVDLKARQTPCIAVSHHKIKGSGSVISIHKGGSST